MSGGSLEKVNTYRADLAGDCEFYCMKNLHLEKHCLELGGVSAQTEFLFATGNQYANAADGTSARH